MTKESKQTFVQGAFFLMAAGIIVKIIGAIFRIPLGNILKEQGSGYYNSAYHIYTFFYVLATSALPVAVSRLISESNARGKYAESQKILKVTSRSFFLIGLACSLTLFFGAGFFSGSVLNNAGSVWAIMAIAPAVLFETVMSTYRGYFQGHKDMVPTSVSQIMVALIKLIVGYLLAWMLISNGFAPEIAAAGAIFGTTAGTVVASLYLVIKKRTKKETISASVLRDDSTASGKVIFKRLMTIVIPITIGSAVLSITGLIDAAMIVGRLRDSGLGYIRESIAAGGAVTGAALESAMEGIANTIYGAYSGYAVVLFNLPTALTFPLGASVVPYIASKMSEGDRGGVKSLVQSGMRITLLIALPFAFGIAMLAEPVMNLLFSNLRIAMFISGTTLKMLGPAIVFVSVVSITNAILQAIGRERVPLMSMLIGCGIKIVVNYFSLGNPDINIAGAPLGTNLCYLAILSVNIFVIAREMGGLKIVKSSVKTLLAAAVCGIGAYFAHMLIWPLAGSKLATLAAVLVGVILYVLCVLFFKTLTREDINMLPKGRNIEKTLEKHGWIG